MMPELVARALMHLVRRDRKYRADHELQGSWGLNQASECRPERRFIPENTGKVVLSADAWIAGTALVLSVPLVTNNPKDYRHLDKLQIVSVAAG
jgi:predicted nucleic acid-binding protein